jgi:hypothetical protein
MMTGDEAEWNGKKSGLSLPQRKRQRPSSVREDGHVREVVVARGFSLKWQGRRGIWASTSGSTDRITRSEPGRSGSVLRPRPRFDSTEEVEEREEQWVIDDLDPLHHEEHAIR